MIKPPRLEDLGREELLILIGRVSLMLSERDLLWAMWSVASDRALAAYDAVSSAYETAAPLVVAMDRARTSAGRMKARNAYLAAHKKISALELRAERLHRRSEALYKQIQDQVDEYRL